jgi:caa(3)-type oxidase subunit IV
MSDNHGFSALKVFVWLFVLTALEVGWAFLPFNKVPLRLGLLVFAYMKGHLIFTYFMHMKFEGWIVKGLIAPTVPLIAIVVFACFPDVSRNDKLLYPVGYQLVEGAGVVMDQAEAAEVRGVGSKQAVSAGGGH